MRVAAEGDDETGALVKLPKAEAAQRRVKESQDQAAEGGRNEQTRTWREGQV